MKRENGGNGIPTAASIRFSDLPAAWEEACLDGRVGGMASGRVCFGKGVVCFLIVRQLLVKMLRI